MAASSLCPGYKCVEEFASDDEYENEEVSYVTLDLGSIEPTLLPSSSTYRLIGLDTPTPFLQLSGMIFKGQHDSLLGTELFLSESNDHNDRNKRSIEYIASTEQRVRFKEVRLVPKTNAPPNPTEICVQETGEDTNKEPLKTKSKRKGKGKTKAKDVRDGEVGVSVGDDGGIVDRITGKFAPPMRNRGRAGPEINDSVQELDIPVEDGVEPEVETDVLLPQVPVNDAMDVEIEI